MYTGKMHTFVRCNPPSSWETGATYLRDSTQQQPAGEPVSANRGMKVRHYRSAGEPNRYLEACGAVEKIGLYYPA